MSAVCTAGFATPASRVVLLVESPLSERDAERFGIDALNDAGFAVEVWELAPIVLPKSEEQMTSRAEGIAISRVANLADLVTLCSSLSKNDTLILLFGVFMGDFTRCADVLRIVSSSHAKLGAVIGTSPWCDYSYSKAYFQEWPVMRFAYLRVRSALVTALRAAVESITTLPGLRHIRRSRSGIRPLDVIWAATSRRPIDQMFIGRRTRIIYLNTFDYEIVRKTNLGSRGTSGVIAYIDGLGPLHPDNNTLESVPLNHTVDTYFSKLRNAFDYVERETGLEVVVAAHPRAQASQLEDKYGKRNVVYGSTSATIRDCRFVLMSYPSSSISMVVALRRPALVIRLNDEFRYDKRMLRELQRKLRLETLKPEDPQVVFKLPTINERAYSQFFRRHVKRPNSSDLPFWEKVAKDIKCLTAGET